MTTAPGTEHLSTATCLDLLRGVPYGRLAVVVDGRPKIFPVNHAVDQGSVVFRTAEGTKLAAADGQPVAFEADGVDAATGLAWSVVVTGVATQLRRLHEVLESLELPVFPWEDGAKPLVVRIEPDGITGRRFAIQGSSAS
ncbi:MULTISPECIES: pyridoxamine 5'-phosphate oxidase family protein [unclassified Janibacter]|uniref:pyridoxamine 5'-phosphate oxidase family protein n=1 Tax=unclassified Janibacter TaxID=2649294 RepID=UPI003CFD5F20